MYNAAMVVYLKHIICKRNLGVLYQDIWNEFAVRTSTTYFFLELCHGR